jgi:hypothetical protein
MFLLPLIAIGMVGLAAYVVLSHRTRPATGVVDAPAIVPAQRASFWPTTIEGKVGIGAFALNFVPIALVNVIQVPYLSVGVLLAALVLTGVARFARHDHSTAVLLAFGVSAIAAVLGLLFLGGEVFIGHD